MSNNGDVKKNVAEELHKSARKNFKRRRTIIIGFGDLWQIDLAEMQPYAKSNRGHRYILVVIDCYSKYVWTRAVKNKTASEVAKAMRVGDVRVSKYKGVFSRGFTPNWSNELFKIAKANITNPATYLLEDMEAKPILGCFYEYELQKTKYPDVYLIEKILRRSGNRVYVRWLGLPDSHNSWVNKADIIKT
ncbi:hypothetical protein NQ315_015918 [Exocentrus adspersus]|uniref:Chromo domain-containing protein n=1 Tax=Exocentrus adspersus TaxID=1586481 RepID=A0AAV8V8K0_9CUCU|nr:hypothetical protein NQ315_015918 [Exocentrus adspersus]